MDNEEKKSVEEVTQDAQAPQDTALPPQEEAPIRGRAAAMERYRAANPDIETDPEDDDLYDYAISQADDYKGRYDRQNEINSALSERISEDPRLGALIAGIMETDEEGNRKNPAYVMAKLYGKDFLEDEDSMKALNEGYAEYLNGANQTKEAGEKASKNFIQSMDKVDQYAQANELGEEQVEGLRQALVQAADDMLNGIFSSAFIETVAKGMAYDADVQEAADTGFVEGKNTKIEAKMKETPDIPSMGGTSNVERDIAPPKPEKKGSFFDEMETVS